MSLHRDRLILQLHSAAPLLALLDPAADPGKSRLIALLRAVYDMPFAALQSVQDVTLRGVEAQRPLQPPLLRRETRSRTTPGYERIDLAGEDLPWTEPEW